MWICANCVPFGAVKNVFSLEIFKVGTVKIEIFFKLFFTQKYLKDSIYLIYFDSIFSDLLVFYVQLNPSQIRYNRRQFDEHQLTCDFQAQK